MLVAPTASLLEKPITLHAARVDPSHDLAEFLELQLLFGIEKLLPLELFQDFRHFRNQEPLSK